MRTWLVTIVENVEVRFMRKRSVILAFLISLGLVLAMTATSLATTIDIDFSGSRSDGKDASALKAVVTYGLDVDSARSHFYHQLRAQ